MDFNANTLAETCVAVEDDDDDVIDDDIVNSVLIVIGMNVHVEWSC